MFNKNVEDELNKPPVLSAARPLLHIKHAPKWLSIGTLLPLLVLVTSLYVTYRLWQDARQAAERAFVAEFEIRVRDLSMRIDQSMKTYEQVLRGAVGLFAANDRVSREQFRAYIDMLNLSVNFPGIQGVGFALVVPAADRDKHINAIRKEGFPLYTIKPDGVRDVYSSIVYLEPFSHLNLRAFGYDMYSEPVRRAAMVTARDHGSAAVTRMVTLVQEGGRNAQTGFLMYLPVYRNDGQRDSFIELRDRHVGWIYAPFRMDDFMAGVSGEQAADLDIQIYDGRKVAEESLMFKSQYDRPGHPTSFYRSVSHIDIGRHEWTIVASATPRFHARTEQDKAIWIYRGGISISILLTLLTWLFLDDRQRAIRAARHALQLALYDALTGLPNRKLITDRLHQAVAKARRNKTLVALMFIDLDKFKPVNDNFGHAVGDLLLQEVAKRLQNSVRKSDTVSRLGGDEFVILLPDVEGKEGVTVVAQKILHTLAEPFQLVEERCHISSSIGIALYPDDSTDETELLRHADIAMYHAKNTGRNNLQYFGQEMRDGRNKEPLDLAEVMAKR